MYIISIHPYIHSTKTIHQYNTCVCALLPFEWSIQYRCNIQFENWKQVEHLPFLITYLWCISGAFKSTRRHYIRQYYCACRRSQYHASKNNAWDIHYPLELYGKWKWKNKTKNKFKFPKSANSLTVTTSHKLCMQTALMEHIYRVCYASHYINHCQSACIQLKVLCRYHILTRYH